MVSPLDAARDRRATPDRGANGPWGNLDTRYRDMPTEKWYEYGFKEGVPRLLEVFERRKVSITSHMVGLAGSRSTPALAKEIVQRGHEAAAHGETAGVDLRHSRVG